MDGCMFRVWNSITKARRENKILKDKIHNIILLLYNYDRDEETAMLGLSLALEDLSDDILNLAISYEDYGWPYDNFGTDIYERIHSLREIIEMGLKHKEIEPVRKHSYNFLRGCIITVIRVLHKIIWA